MLMQRNANDYSISPTFLSQLFRFAYCWERCLSRKLKSLSSLCTMLSHIEWLIC